MSLPNPPYIGNPIPNQPFHSPETPATFDRLFGTLVPNIQLDPNPTAPYPEPWRRPGDWLALPRIKSTQEKFAGLLPVYNVDSNFVAFTFEGDYVVDWGDGSVDYVSSGEKAQHAYSWGRIPSPTITSQGYRQVIITVTPQSGSHLTRMNLAYLHDNLHLGDPVNFTCIPWLDIAVSMPNAESGASMTLTSAYSEVAVSLLEKLTVINAGGATDLQELATGYNLREFNLRNAPNLEDARYMFYRCYNLQIASMSGLTSLVRLDWMFSNCWNLVSVDLSDLGSALFFSEIFGECRSLKKVKMSGLHAADGTDLYHLLNSYRQQPNTIDLTLEDLHSLSDASMAFSGWSDLRGSLTLTGLTNLTNIDYAFDYNSGLTSVYLSGLDNVTSAIQTFSDCYSLQRVHLQGTQNIENMYYMFAYCYSMIETPVFDTSSAVDMTEMYGDCESLRIVHPFDTSSLEEAGWLFYDCYSLQHVPFLDLSSVTNTEGMFSWAYSLKTVPQFDLSGVENASRMFERCVGLNRVPALNLSSCGDFSYVFSNCPVLAAAPLQEVSQDISYYNCCLSRNAIVEIFNGLANASATIDVSYNYGAADLTPEDIAIAEGKGWSVTY